MTQAVGDFLGKAQDVAQVGLGVILIGTAMLILFGETKAGGELFKVGKGAAKLAVTHRV